MKRAKRTSALSHGDNVTLAEAKMIRGMADRCLKELSKKEHELIYVGDPVRYQSMKARCLVEVKYRGQCSYGGQRGITIDLWSLRNSKTFMSEYASIAKDSAIGSMECGTLENRLMCVVAHEVAHHVQQLYGPHTRWLRAQYRKPHGTGWRALYRILRSRIVNPAAEVAGSQAA